MAPPSSWKTQDDGKAIGYQIVGEDEADIKSGRISITSPIARALVGKSAGDVVDVAAPGGKHSYEIVKVTLRLTSFTRGRA